MSFMLIFLLAGITTAMIFYFVQISPYNALIKRLEQQQIASLAQSLSITGLAAVKILKNGNTDELTGFLNEVEKQDAGHIFLLQEDNSSISGRKIPNGVDDFVTASSNSHKLQHAASKTEVMVALPLSTGDGRVLTIVGTVPRNANPPVFWGKNKQNRRPVLFFRHSLPLPLFIMICIAAVGCYLLARSLTAPIRELRKATQRISRGDFSARVEQLSRRGDEIAELSCDFNIMAEQTQSLLQSQRRLLRDISHELRSPLTRQNMALELARQHCSEGEPYLARIEKESNRMDELIGQLLMLTRLENDVRDLAKEAVNVPKLVRAIARDAEFEATAQGKRIAIQNLAEVTVHGSREMLGRAIENVIRNGLRYTSAGDCVEINVSHFDGRANITIRDHGPGVPEQHLEQIFKPFFRVAESRDRKSGGTGVGLAIAKQAALMHGGTVKAENAENGGLLVEMFLPLL
jgi:two-component system sensor histidine kinase CpxA